MPVRRRALLAAGGAHILARGEAADSLRHGPVPGQDLRTRDAISFQLESGFGSTAGVPGARGKPCCLSSARAAGPSSHRRTSMNWKGVMPVITTCFNQDLSINHGFLAEHCHWLLENGCVGVVALGSLGEGATLSFNEKLDILRSCVKAIHGDGVVVASISSLTTSEAVALAKAATDIGCSGL